MNDSERRALATKIRRYVRDRAKIEEVEFNLTLRFFIDALNKGVVSFFGVVVERGKMVRDDQEPREGYFEEWEAGKGASK